MSDENFTSKRMLKKVDSWLILFVQFMCFVNAAQNPHSLSSKHGRGSL